MSFKLAGGISGKNTVYETPTKWLALPGASRETGATVGKCQSYVSGVLHGWELGGKDISRP
jgi:cystathionine beta-lyase family protein involved in aluminum resistance